MAINIEIIEIKLFCIIKTSVLFVNKVDIYKYLNASDLAVFPASQSILWQQAISMDLPLIAGNTGHQSIDYLNEFNSIVILEKNEITIEKIAENILRLINDKPLFESMKIGAQKATEKYLNWDKLILKTLQFNS